MYIRFVTAKRDGQSGRRRGLFYAAYELEECDHLGEADLRSLHVIHDWFAKNMREPTRAALSSRPNRKT